MYVKNGKANSAKRHIGPWPEDPNFISWWERERDREMKALKEATARNDVREMRLASRRIREAKQMLREGAAR